MGSTRRPGKTLALIEGKPMLWHIIQRLKRCNNVDQIIVATTQEKKDNAVAKLCGMEKIGCYRGSSNDVLFRVLQAAKQFKADLIIEVCGDCPLIDPKIVDEAIDFYLKHTFDFVGMIKPRTFPIGLEANIYVTKVLERVAKLTSDPLYREHVSNFIYEHSEMFSLGNITAPNELQRTDIRFTVDTEEDLHLVRRIYKELYPRNPYFRAIEAVQLVDNLDLKKKKKS